MSTGRASVQCSIIMLDGPAEKKIQTNKQHTAMWITLREKFLFLIDFKVHWRVGQFRYPGLKTAFPVNIKNMADNTLESSLALRPVHKHMHIHGNIYQPHLNLLNIVLVVCFRSSVVFYWAQKNIAKLFSFSSMTAPDRTKKKYCKTEKPPKTRQKYLWSTHTLCARTPHSTLKTEQRYTSNSEARKAHFAYSHLIKNFTLPPTDETYLIYPIHNSSHFGYFCRWKIALTIFFWLELNFPQKKHANLFDNWTTQYWVM